MIKIDDNLIVRGLTFLPPLLGIIIFTYILKFSGFEQVQLRLPLFQGLTSYFSLIFLGFTYIKNRHKIIGIKIIPLLILIFVFPILYYIYNGLDTILTLVLAIILFLNSITSYILLTKNNRKNYLYYLILLAILLPLCLVLNVLILLFIVIIIVIILFSVIIPQWKNFESFEYSENGLNIVKSLLLQSPLIILPFFDFKIAELIGPVNYSNYVLMFKYINGFIVLLFSFKQLNLIFDGSLAKQDRIVYQLITTLLILVICSFFEGYFLFAISVGLLSLGLNLSSLLIRKELLNGISFRHSLIGLFFVLFYLTVINEFGSFITLTNSVFIVFMSIAAIFTSLIINFLYRK